MAPSLILTDERFWEMLANNRSGQNAMKSLRQKLVARIANLKKTGSHPLALEAMQEQLRGIEASAGQSLEEIYLLGLRGPTPIQDDSPSSVDTSHAKRQFLIDQMVASAFDDHSPGGSIQDLSDEVGGSADVFIMPVNVSKVGDSYLDDESMLEYLDIEEDKLTDELRTSYARERLESWIEEPDADAQLGVYGDWFLDSENRKALICYSITGYSFSELTIEDVGAFKSKEDLIKYYRKSGHIFSSNEISDEELIKFWRP